MDSCTFRIEKTNTYDVVVCGAGSAGVVAAISAARNGARVVLVERNGEVGGTATSALVGPFMTCFTPDGRRQIVGGIFDEIIRKLEKKGGAIHPSRTGLVSDYGCFISHRHNNVTPFSPGLMTIVMADMLHEAGVTVLVNNVIVDAVMDDERRTVKGVVTYDGEVFREFIADVVIDATGDAVVSKKAGVSCLQGSPKDPKDVQPMTLFFWIYNADDKKINDYLDCNPDMKYQPYNAMIEADRASGRFPIPRSKIGLYHMVNEGEWRLNTTRLQGFDPTDPDSLSNAYFEGLKQVEFLLDYFRKCPGLENARLGQIGNMMGIRESRRIVGEYVLKKEDLMNAEPFEDVIALCSYPVDMHPSKGNVIGLNEKLSVADVYGIPYRVMVPEIVDNLLVAGRCISATREALAAVRIMPCVMAMGEAAGVAAAMSVKGKTKPRDLDIAKLRQTLKAQGAFVDI